MHIPYMVHIKVQMTDVNSATIGKFNHFLLIKKLQNFNTFQLLTAVTIEIPAMCSNMERNCLYLPPFIILSVRKPWKLSTAHVDPQSIKLLKVSKWSCIFYIFNTVSFSTCAKMTNFHRPFCFNWISTNTNN